MAAARSIRGVETLAAAITRVRSVWPCNLDERLAHIFVVARDCTDPRRSRGTDFIVQVEVMDASLVDAPAEARLPQHVQLTVFAPNHRDMPAASDGDVLELRGVAVQFWNGKPQLFAKMAGASGFGFVTYPLRPVPGEDPVQPRQSFNVLTAAGDQTTTRVAELRAFAPRVLPIDVHERDERDASSYLKLIQDLGPPCQADAAPVCVDMRVRVLGFDARENAADVTMWVWDGTDARPVSASLTIPPATWRGVELSMPAPRQRHLPLLDVPPGVSVLPLDELPAMGTALPVVMESDACRGRGLPALGSWVKLKVVGLAAVKGQLQLVFGRCSRIVQSEGASQLPPRLRDMYEQRVDSNETSTWATRGGAVVARCLRQQLRHMTLRQVAQALARGEPGPFRVYVRLVGRMPEQLEHWCQCMATASVSGQQQQLAEVDKQKQTEQQQREHQQEQQQELQQHDREQQIHMQPAHDTQACTHQAWSWVAALLLEDATGQLLSLLLSHNGTRLLGLPPRDLHGCADAVQQLSGRLHALCVVDASGSTWLDAALVRTGELEEWLSAQPGLSQVAPLAPSASPLQTEDREQLEGNAARRRTGQDRLLLETVCIAMYSQELAIHREQTVGVQPKPMDASCANKRARCDVDDDSTSSAAA